MKHWIEKTEENIYIVTAPSYRLAVRAHSFDVSIAENRFCTLDVRTSLPQTSDTLSEIGEHEPEFPVLTAVEEQTGEITFTWCGKSDLWEKKIYVLHCDFLRFTYTVTVCGKGDVDSVQYFSGDRTGAKPGSAYEFSEGFTPCVSWYNEEDYRFRASMDCHRWSVLMVPPMFSYSFGMTGVRDRLSLGLVAQRGEHNFHAFDYKVVRHEWGSGFYLTTDQSGHTHVDGTWTAPAIIGYGAANEDDALRKYTDYYFTSGIAKPHTTGLPPRFWQGPMLCGWLEQAMRVGDPAFPGMTITELAREELYETLAGKLSKYDMHPTALIIDDKWQAHYATDEADPGKWKDLRAFVDRRHREGIHTMLWFKLWDPDGWDAKLCVTADNGEVRIDPSTPEFLENLDRALYRILSADDGCYDCDGFKLDFAFINPIGRRVKTFSGKYGVELLYDMMAYIYNKAKEIKPYALVNCSPCHPYFAHICDQARLHDYDSKNRDNREDLEMRARMFSLAMPGVLLDTDNAGFNTYRDTMRWQMDQHMIGVPDLYALSGNDSCPLGDEDFLAISAMWREYGKRIDLLYDAQPE